MPNRQKPFKLPMDEVFDAYLVDLCATIKREKPLPDEVGKFFRSYLSCRPSKAPSGLKRLQPPMRLALWDMVIFALVMQRKMLNPKRVLRKSGKS